MVKNKQKNKQKKIKNDIPLEIFIEIFKHIKNIDTMITFATLSKYIYLETSIFLRKKLNLSFDELKKIKNAKIKYLMKERNPEKYEKIYLLSKYFGINLVNEEIKILDNNLYSIKLIINYCDYSLEIFPNYRDIEDECFEYLDVRLKYCICYNKEESIYFISKLKYGKEKKLRFGHFLYICEWYINNIKKENFFNNIYNNENYYLKINKKIKIYKDSDYILFDNIYIRNFRIGKGIEDKVIELRKKLDEKNIKYKLSKNKFSEYKFEDIVF